MFNNIHQGSWFGLPDLGITEAVGGLFGSSTTSQGGSNLIGSPNKNAQSVQGTSTQNQGFIGPTYNGPINTTPTNNLNSNSNPVPNQGGGITQPETVSWEQTMRNQINNGWDSYIDSLNDMLNNGLTPQKTAQEDIVNSQYDQGVNQINTQKVTSIRDIGENISNAFKSGNNYLGGMMGGANSPSASNMYSFALTKEANKQRSRVNEITNSEINNLKSTRDQQIDQIATWFGEQQNAIKQAIANGQLNKSKDLQAISSQLYNQGIQWLNQVNQNMESKKNALLSWAATNSTNIDQLQNNISQIPKIMGNPVMQSSTNSGLPAVGYGAGSSTDKKIIGTDMFGQPIYG